jgi:hypothetical protein
MFLSGTKAKILSGKLRTFEEAEKKPVKRLATFFLPAMRLCNLGN